MTEPIKKKGLTYAEAGVDIDAGQEAVERIKKLARATFNAQVLTEIGTFGGMYQLDLSGLKSPVLVSSTDGVGTKVKIAIMTNRHDTVGQDLVNHCVNDILVHGARPLFFMDYIGAGKLRPDVIAEIVDGLSRACREAEMPLLGGETAEMPDVYGPGEYDLVGFVVGLADRRRITDGSAIKAGDVCLGLPSVGLHTNGYTLARKVIFEIAGHRPEDHVAEIGGSVAQVLMAVHRCYAPVVRPLLGKYDIHGMAHITGGGIPGNLNRIMPSGLGAVVKKSSWPVPPVFRYLQKMGQLDPDDSYRTFNMGIGYILVVSPSEADRIEAELTGKSEKVHRIGVVQKQSDPVVMVE